LALRDLRFSYRGHARPVLDGVDLELHRGEWVSLRGESGQGKTTLIDLIGGILRPSGGEILLNGSPAASYSHADYYRLVAVVPQEIYLTGTTVDEIVTWDGHLGDVTPAVYTKALGVDTMFAFSSASNREVDELGRDLSGGMRVRLAMARALAAGPALLVLDETTSRLHVEAEAEIFSRLKTLRPDLAVLLVTHRADSLRFVDRQLRLADGRVEEEQRCQSA
jgi:ABC-type bacteriocin/lantibiotic exporter with double-glycine peptidase domain